MNAPRIQVLLSLLIVCCPPVWIGQQAVSAAVRAQEAPPTADAASPEAAMDTQLRINKTTLLENSISKNRIDAATLLLFSENPAAREIVLDVLRRTDNPQARAAVCDALNPARVGQKPLKNKDDFVKPLIAILTSEEDPAIAKRAAEATLLFGYSQVQQDLEKAATDRSLSVNVRIIIIYALKRHPDTQAVAKLISLLESPDPPILEAAAAALVSVGIPVSQDAAAQRQMLTELQQRGPEAFLRERLVRQETRVRELETDLSDWQKRYLASLSDLHDSLPNEVAKTEFLARQLNSQEIVVRLWALDKLQELRRAKGTLKLSVLEPILSALISDPSRQVRVKTARVLALIGELNTSKPLLEQLKIEQDEQNKREILVALRETCYAGSMATAAYKVPDEVRRETLDWAVKFLNDADTEKVRSGADVIGKLLEQDGLKPADVDRCLNVLSTRYTQSGAGAEVGVRGYLLGAMARLCATRSVCREQAVKLYAGLFEHALADKTDDVARQNAIDGWINVDKPGALRKFRENNMTADSNVAIRRKLVDLASETGTVQDLDWLAEKVGIAGDGEAAWQAMLKIFKRSDLAILPGWAAKIDVLAAGGKIATEQRIAFFTLVEQRAQNENAADLLKAARMSLAQLYVASNNLKQASECLNTLLGAAVTEEERQQVQPQLLRVYLGLASMDQASDLISKCLLAKDLDLSSDGFLVKVIEEYLNNPTTTEPGVLLGVLGQIRVRDSGTSQTWHALLSRWSERFAKAKKAEDGGRTNN
ncbi:MAG: HEAT repeat domain-containing protein [Phycisphaerae bacterium]|nr:HEAT repeat domain-containing protein [Phycisphaerae bacterium]